ncbi:hypothetical protein BGZ76_010146 [Entomortierella beljakovae]|nr:hypothetical protein BGZ76_010146 [Entomortierella beljakovae]
MAGTGNGNPDLNPLFIEDEFNFKVPYTPPWPNAVSPTISFGIAIGYIFILGIMAILMCYRSRTPLRVAVCLFTYLDLSTAVIGLLWSLSDKVNGMWYWPWKIVAESIGMLSLSYTILTVGNGFYPMTGKKRTCWVITVSLIVTYALLTIAITTYYIQQKFAHHNLSPSRIMDMMTTVQDEGLIWADDCKRYDSGNGTDIVRDGIVGVDNWTQLKCYTLLEIYSRPNIWIYVAYQLIMITTCTWTSFYLFMPLVKSLQSGGAVPRPNDSNPKAIGVWYLSCLQIIMVVYSSLMIYLCFNQWKTYLPQIQALEICIRATISPVLSLPAPHFLLRFFSRNTKHYVIGNNSLGAYGGGGVGSKNGGERGNSSYRGSFVMDDPNSRSSAPQSPTGPQVSFNYAASGIDRQDSVGSTYSRMNLFQNGRGSTESSNNRPSRDFKQEYYDIRSRDIELSSKPTMGNFNNEIIYSVPFSSAESGLHYRDSGIQKPEPALTSVSLNDLVRSLSVSETTVSVPYITDSEEKPVNTVAEVIDNTPVTGSTGWEVGGWDHIRTSSDGNNEISLTSPMDGYYLNSPQSSVNPNSSEVTSVVIDLRAKEPEASTVCFDSNGVELTGLRKQLAEYHSALLPVVIAIQEQDDCDSSLEPCDDGNYNAANTEQDARRYRPKVPNKRFPDATIGPMHSSYNEPSSTQPLEGPATEMATTHANKPLNWSNLTTTTLSTHGSDDSNIGPNVSQTALPSSKATEKSALGFRMKWLPSRKQNDDDHKDMVPAPSSEEFKGGRRSSITANNDAAQTTKNAKHKESRRGVFSKVLGGERGRLSHDIGDQERDPKALDSEGKAQNSQSNNSTPATVEALALESTMNPFDFNDDEKGLQYYYPDPYHSLAEFTKPQASFRDQPSQQGATVKRSTSMSSQRHPLSTIFSDDELADTESSFTNLNPSIADNMSGNASSSRISLSLSLKSNKSAKKLSKKDIAMMYYQESSNIDPNNNSGSSIKSGSTSKSSEQYVSTKNSKQSKLDSKAPAVSPPAQTSLSPPPRQNWARTKSFQGISTPSMPSLKFAAGIKIDTKLANESSGPKTSLSSDADPSSSGVRSSLSSSLGSPTSASLSPRLSPSGTRRGEPDTLAIESTSPTLPPLQSTLGVPRLAGQKSRLSTDYRANSLDKEGEYYASLDNRAGFSTAAMDMRRASNRHQRSVDNLTSSYYYKRGTDGETFQKGKSSLEYMTPGMTSSTSSPSLPNEGVATGDSGRSTSFTNSLRFMANDDSWTQAMVARAKNGGSKLESENQHPRRHPVSGRTPSPTSPNIDTSESNIGQRNRSGTFNGQSSDSGARGDTNIPHLPEYYTRRPSINRSGSE